MIAFSMFQPLAQVSLGSIGDTHDEILNTIKIPNDDVTKNTFPIANLTFGSVDGVDFNLASSVYFQLGLELDDQFESASKNSFGSQIKNVDFTENEETTSAINNWVEDETHKHIKNIVTPSITAETVLYLVNTIYFKGSWEEPFDKFNTEDIDYHVTKHVTMKIPTMCRRGYYNYIESAELNAKVLEIFFEGRESSFIVVVPYEDEGIPNLMKKLEDIDAIDEAIKKMTTQDVNIYIPKFTIESSPDQVYNLKAIGIQSLFDNPELDKLIKGNIDLSVSCAIHKAFITVDEEGVEAAGANVFGFGNGRLINQSPESEFKADRPFYFEIRVKSQRFFSGIFYHANKSMTLNH